MESVQYDISEPNEMLKCYIPPKRAMFIKL